MLTEADIRYQVWSRRSGHVPSRFTASDKHRQTLIWDPQLDSYESIAPLSLNNNRVLTTRSYLPQHTSLLFSLSSMAEMANY